MAEKTSRFGDTIQTEDVVVEAENLEGRAVETGRFGDAVRDPAQGAADAVDFVRQGGAEGLGIPRAQGLMSEFPMEPGTSAAAMGASNLDEWTGKRTPILDEAGNNVQPALPEMFIGKNVMKPRYEELSAIVSDPERSAWEKFGANMELKEMMESGGVTERVGSGMGEGLSMKDKAMISAAAMTMFDPAEVAQMLMQNDPETGERRWPQFAMQHAPDGTIIMSNNLNGAQSMINAPGMSKMDVVQGLGVAAAFTPAGRATSAVKATVPRMLVGAGTAGVTEEIIQRGQEAAGGQYDGTDVALSAGLGPLVELGRPLIGLTQRVGKFIGSYIPESVMASAQGLKGVIPKVKAEVIQFAEDAEKYLKSGRPARVMTEDAVPEAHSPWRKIILKVIERMPLTGTGGARVAQREQRVEVLRHLADSFGLDPNTNYGATVIKELNGLSGEALIAARKLVGEGAETMAENVEMKVNIKDFRFKVRDLIEKEESYGGMSNQGVVDLLNKARNAVWQGGKEQDFARGFGRLSDWLERLRMEATHGSPQARAVITEAADALEADLKRTASESGGEAGQRWLTGMAQEGRIVAEAQAKTVRGLIESGEIDSQVIRRVLKSGNVEDLTMLRDSMSGEGIQSARQMILRNAMRVGGWRRSAANEATVSPAKVLAWLEKEPVEAQLRTFFPDGELNGMMEYLKMTAQAESIGKGVGMAASGGVGQGIGNAVNIVTLGAIGALGHTYQSAPIRNLLLRLYHIGPDVRAKDAIMKQLTPLLMGVGRQMMQDKFEDDPQRSDYLSDEYQEAQREEGESASAMEQLRTAAGMNEEEDEGPGITDRLLQMIGMGSDEAPVEEEVQ